MMTTTEYQATREYLLAAIDQQISIARLWRLDGRYDLVAQSHAIGEQYEAMLNQLDTEAQR